MEELFALAAKGGPVFYALSIALLGLIWRALEGVREAMQQIADAQTSQSSAMRDQADTTRELVQGTTEIIRMMEKFQAASAERHNANVDKLNLLLNRRQSG